jgi:DME family drug/metabolite transporter
LTLNAWTRCLPIKLCESEISGPVVAQSHPWRGYLFVALATLGWGAAATFGKLVFSGQLLAGQPAISPLVLTQTRVTFSFVLLALFLLLRDGRRAFGISRRDLLACMAVGALGLGISAFFYYVAIQKTTVGVAITVQYTAPVWVLTWMTLRGRERATGARIAAVGLALLGVAMTIGLFYGDIHLNTWGVAAAIIASFGFSFYNIGAQELITRIHPFKVMTYALLGSMLVWLLVNPPWLLVQQHFSAGQWGILFLFACCSMLVPFAFYFMGLKYLDPTRAVVTSCLEPVFAILLAGIFVHETLRPLQIAGVLTVLAATMMVQMQSGREQ